MKVQQSDGTVKDEVVLTGSFIELGRQLNKTVTPGSRISLFSSFSILRKEITDYKEIIINIRANASHSWAIDIDWNVPQFTFAAVIYSDTNLIDVTNIWGSTYIKLKTQRFNLFLKNKDTVDHTYDLYIFATR